MVDNNKSLDPLRAKRNIHKKEVGSYHGFGYSSLISDPLNLAKGARGKKKTVNLQILTWHAQLSQRRKYQNTLNLFRKWMILYDHFGVLRIYSMISKDQKENIICTIYELGETFYGRHMAQHPAKVIANNNKSLDPLRAKKTFIRKMLGHTAVSATQASTLFTQSKLYPDMFDGGA